MAGRPGIIILREGTDTSQVRTLLQDFKYRNERSIATIQSKL